VVYGLAGWCSEILSTGLRSRGRDRNWRLTGTTYLWMLPIYGGGALAFEPVLDQMRSRRVPVAARAAVWVGAVYVLEAVSGELLRAATGEVPWDYSRPRGGKGEPVHWRGLVRPAYAPVWALVGLGFEQLHDVLVRIRLEPPE
jgi:hypothetical protein